MIADEGELHGCSLAKNAAAFFKISRSIRSRAFSLRSRAFSAANAPSPAGARPAWEESLATHARTELGSTPRLRAASGIEYPCWLTSLTADILNSRVNFLRAIHRSFRQYYAAFRRAHHSWGRSNPHPQPSPCEYTGRGGRASYCRHQVDRLLIDRAALV